MVHSTWGDWFLTHEVEAHDPDGVAVWYLGCNGFVLRSSEATLYVDPYFGDGDPPMIVRMIPVPLDPADVTQCDAVLATHEHVDHMHPPSYAPLVADGADVYAPGASYDADARQYDGPVDGSVPADRKHVVDVGDAVEVGDFTVHVRGSHDPDAVEPVSYVVEHDAGTFFHAGDSKPADAFYDVGRAFDVDLAAVALGSVGTIYDPEEDEARPTRWYADENQVVEMASALRTTRLLPSHYDIWRGVTADPAAVLDHAASYRYPEVVEVARVGDRLALDGPGVRQDHTLGA
jgi:L-ascorbate 6-phosphate lactonase